MAKKAKKRSVAKSGARRATSHRPRSSNPKPFMKGHRRRKSMNPFQFFGGSAKPKTLAKATVGVLAGVAIGRTVTNMLPTSFTSSNLTHTLTAAGVALLEWWALSMIDSEFGAAAGLGGLAYAGNVALNAFLPEAGQYVGISGVRRGTGDFVPADKSGFLTTLSVNRGIPVTGNIGANAYPDAYARRAA